MRAVRSIPPTVALAFIAAPLIMLATLIVHNGGFEHVHTEQFGSQVETAWAQHLRYYVGHMGFVAGFVLLVPGLLAFGRRLSAAGAEHADIGVAFAIVGLIGGSLSVGVDLAIYQLTTPSRGGEAATQVLAGTNFEPEVLGPIAVLALGLGIGLTLLMVAAVRAGLTSRWSAAAVAFGGLGSGLLFNTDLAVPNALLFALGGGRLALGWTRSQAPSANSATAVSISTLGEAT